MSKPQDFVPKDSWAEETWSEQPWPEGNDRALMASVSSSHRKTTLTTPKTKKTRDPRSKASQKYIHICVPCVYHDEHGLNFAPRGHLSVSSDMPLMEGVQACIQGDTVMRAGTGFSTCQTSLQWSVPRDLGRLTTGLQLSERGPQPMVGYQATTRSMQWRTIVDGKQLMMSTLYPTKYGKLHTRVQWRLNLANTPAPTAQVSFVSPHRWRMGLAYDVNERRPLLSLSTQPKISEHRTLALSATLSSFWSVGGHIHQQITKVSRLSVGVQYESRRGLTWLWGWSDTEWSVRIPVWMPQGGVFATVYMAFVSMAVQDVLAHVFSNVTLSINDSNLTNNDKTIDYKEQREHAQQQQLLMAKQAQKRTREEMEKRGLVIEKATYYYKKRGRLEKTSEEMDVTIPLQFWVYESSLDLSETSKSRLLGFSELPPTLNENKDAKMDESFKSRSWKRFWALKNNGYDKTAEDAKDGPFLTIDYQYAGASFEVTIHDTEGLTLP